MAETKKIKPVAVLISDVHYNLQTLELADAALNQALRKAEDLNVPLIIAGDLHDTKGALRGECVDRLIRTLSTRLHNAIDVYVLIGNHDRINEKAQAHSLEFLRPHAKIIDAPTWCKELNLWMVPYDHDSVALKDTLGNIRDGSTIIMHQGVQSAYMGEYVQDKSSLPKEVFANYRVISGHYHRRQDIKCGRPRKGAVGLFSYIGNPFTLTFGEASDPEKGFQVLMSDGLLGFVGTNLRRHEILELTTKQLFGGILTGTKYPPETLLWVKVTGPKSELRLVEKDAIGEQILGHANFRLDLIPDDAAPVLEETKKLKDEELLDALIDGVSEPEEEKILLKSLWREVYEAT